MSNTPAPQDDARMDLLWDYLHGELAEAQIKDFEQALRDNPELVGTSMDLVELTVMTRDVLQRGEAVRKEAMLNSVADSSESGAMEALNELARMEAAAPVVLRSVDVPKKQKKQKDPNEPTPQDYINAGRYVLRLVFTSKPAKKLYTWSAIAAVLLLAFVLFNPFASDTPDTVADLDFWDDIDTSTPSAVAPGITAVATLTAQHNAQWTPAGGASAPPANLTVGSKLHPNQRLTLTAGFAEITTHDGAIAILEAPATVELLDHNNALRLHTGKLVGICETELSKGFVVKTDHADIVDLGTEFGVNVADNQLTTTVFAGEVELTTPGQAPKPLVANQTATLDAGVGARVVVENSLVNSFTRRVPGSVQGVFIAGSAYSSDIAPSTNRPDTTNWHDTGGDPTAPGGVAWGDSELFDGTIDTSKVSNNVVGWNGEPGDPSSFPTLVFDLGGLYDLQSIDLWHRPNNGRIQSIAISVSTDNVNYSAATTYTPSWSKDHCQLDLSKFQNARYVRLYLTGNDWIMLSEVGFGGAHAPQPGPSGITEPR